MCESFRSAGVSQTASGTITGNLVGVRANGVVDLNNAANSASILALNNAAAGAAVDFEDADGLIIGTVGADGGGIFTATSGVTNKMAAQSTWIPAR